MSIIKNEEYIGNKKINKYNENNYYFIMKYKLDEKEKKEEIKKLKEEKIFILNDKKEYTDNLIRIFGKNFVKKNKNKCKIIFNNKKYKLKEYFNSINNNYIYYLGKIKEIKLKLIGITTVTNMKEMFYGCYYLSSVSESSELKLKHNNEYEYNNINYNLVNIYPDINEKKDNYLLNILNNTEYSELNQLYNENTLLYLIRPYINFIINL